MEGGWRRSVRNTSYICSFINLANLASCSASRLSLGVLCTGAAQIEKARAVKSGMGAKIIPSPQSGRSFLELLTDFTAGLYFS